MRAGEFATRLRAAWKSAFSVPDRTAPSRNVWSVFFGIFTVLILVTFVFPASFGMQSFTQWGGMYDDHWCNVDLYSSDPQSTPADTLRHEFRAAGRGHTFVYSIPTHNMHSCMVWAHTLCGRTTADGWIISWISPMFQGVHYVDPVNLCAVSLPDDWFVYHGN